MGVRSDRLQLRKARARRRWTAAWIAALAFLTFGGIARGAVSQVDEMTVCVAANGSVRNFNPYEGDCNGQEQEVAWAVHGIAATTTTTTTQPPTSSSTTTTTASSSHAKPDAGGYFTLLAPGSTLPTEQQCAVRVRSSQWEPRPDNTTANHTLPSHLPLGTFTAFDSKWASSYQTRVLGDFTGTTEQLIEFYACKWGWNDNFVRAQAVVESSWRQSTVGDSSTSYGILQVRYLYHPRVQGGCKACAGSSWPDSQNSTAFNIDLQLAEMRGCYDGHEPYLGNTTGDYEGCIGSWYSGNWRSADALKYLGWWHAALDAKAWLTWAG